MSTLTCRSPLAVINFRTARSAYPPCLLVACPVGKYNQGENHDLSIRSANANTRLWIQANEVVVMVAPPQDPVRCRLSPAVAEQPAPTSAAGQHIAASEKKGRGQERRHSILYSIPYYRKTGSLILALFSLTIPRKTLCSGILRHVLSPPEGGSLRSPHPACVQS